MSAYFITGTGTGIGKTFSTCALLHAAKNAKGYKPVISGFGTGDCDTTQIIEAMGAGSIDEVSPWRFEVPLSPDMAAAKEDRRLEATALTDWTRSVVASAPHVFIETVGGLMVPLNDRETTRDWLVRCDLPLIMVTGSYLGALSHTLSTLEAARAAKLTVVALIINESGNSTVDLHETKKSLACHARDIPLILAQPRVASAKEATVIHALVGQLA